MTEGPGDRRVTEGPGDRRVRGGPGDRRVTEGPGGGWIVIIKCLTVCVHHTQERYDLFGSGGAERLCAEYKLPFFGQVPLDPVSVCL